MTAPDLEKVLRARRDGGGRAFVPYVTGGYPGVDAALLEALQAAGADAIEVGIPFSDPVMDGGVIQEASRAALEQGTRPDDVLRTIAEAELEVPVATMTYVNPVFHRGFDAFLGDLAEAGVAGVIVPDLPVDEAEPFRQAADERGIANVAIAAPGIAPSRLETIASSTRGFVYCVAAYGVTGTRDELAGTAEELVSALRRMTDVPLLLGVGIGTPFQAAEACSFADGVIVGSALMAAMLDGDRHGAIRLAHSFGDAVHSS
jgi:tryptophan synthase alpha chain